MSCTQTLNSSCADLQYGSTEIGNRGGIYVPGVTPWVDLRCDR